MEVPTPFFLCLSSPRMPFLRQPSKPRPRRPLSLGTASALCSDLLQPLESRNPTQQHRPAWASRFLTLPTRQPGWFWNSSGMFPWSQDLPDFPLELHQVSAPSVPHEDSSSSTSRPKPLTHWPIAHGPAVSIHPSPHSSPSACTSVYWRPPRPSAPHLEVAGHWVLSSAQRALLNPFTPAQDLQSWFLLKWPCISSKFHFIVFSVLSVCQDLSESWFWHVTP